MKTAKWANLMVLSLVVILQGCAFESAIVDVQEPRAGFVITKPPMQISYRGDMTPEAQAFTMRVIRELKSIPYKDYKFNENHNVRLNSIDGKSDTIDIKLVESTASLKNDGISPEEDTE